MITGEATFGTMCLRIRRGDVAPSERADSMKFSSRTAMTCPRIRRTKPGTKTMPMASAVSLTLAPRSAATVRARIRGGKENMASMRRMITLSTAPRKKPAMSPSGMAIAAATATISKVARSDVRPPQIRRLKMSRPRSSVPSQWASEGPALIRLRFWVFGS